MSGGGHPEKRSWAKNCRIVIDVDSATKLPEGESYQGARGFWVEAGSTEREPFGYSDLLLENLTIVARSNAKPFPILLVDNSHGSVIARSMEVRSDVPDSMPIDIQSVDDSYVEEPYGVTLESVLVDADVPRTAEGYAIRIDRRPDSLLRDVTVNVPRGTVGGIAITDSPGVEIVDTHVQTHFSRRRIFDEEVHEKVGTNTGILIMNSGDYEIKNSRFDVPGDERKIVPPSSSKGQNGSQARSN